MCLPRASKQRPMIAIVVCIGLFQLCRVSCRFCFDGEVWEGLGADGARTVPSSRLVRPFVPSPADRRFFCSHVGSWRQAQVLVVAVPLRGYCHGPGSCIMGWALCCPGGTRARGGRLRVPFDRPRLGWILGLRIHSELDSLAR